MLGSIDGGTTIRGGSGDSASQGFVAPISAPTSQASLTKKRRLTTPGWLRLGLVVTTLPVVAFAAAVHVGLARNADTVQTVGEDATRGITVAQELKLNLAELDAIAVQELLAPPALGEGGFPQAYNTKRVELQQNLIAAAGESPGPAYGQALANIDYVLGHYHSTMADTFAAAVTQDTAAVVQNYDKAHAIMRVTLLPEADKVDKAHTYVLNDTYGRQKDRALSTKGWIVGTWAVLVGLLVVAQLVFAQKFHRILSIPLVVATLLAVACLAGAVSGLERSADKLGLARDQAFDSIHKLARARSAAAEAQQAQGDHLLDPTDPTAALSFGEHTDRLFRDSESDGEEIADIARSGDFDGSEGGYLGSVANAEVAAAGRVNTEVAVHELGEFLEADESMRQILEDGDRAGAIATVYGGGSAFHELDEAIAAAQGTAQEVFDDNTEAAEDAARPLPWLNITLAGGMIVLIAAGFWSRLREYTR